MALVRGSHLHTKDSPKFESLCSSKPTNTKKHFSMLLNSNANTFLPLSSGHHCRKRVSYAKSLQPMNGIAPAPPKTQKRPMTPHARKVDKQRVRTVKDVQKDNLAGFGPWITFENVSELNMIFEDLQAERTNQARNARKPFLATPPNPSVRPSTAFSRPRRCNLKP